MLDVRTHIHAIRRKLLCQLTLSNTSVPKHARGSFLRTPNVALKNKRENFGIATSIFASGIVSLDLPKQRGPLVPSNFLIPDIELLLSGSAHSTQKDFLSVLIFFK